MNLRESLVNRAQHVFVPLDLQIRVQAALQQDARSAQLDHLFDLLVDYFERLDVTLFRTERPVERAERAILRAEIRVVDVAVDLIRRDARIGLLAADFVGRHSDTDQVVGVEKIERFLWCQTHGYERAVWLARCAELGAVPPTNSSGRARGIRPAAAAFSK